MNQISPGLLCSKPASLGVPECLRVKEIAQMQVLLFKTSVKIYLKNLPYWKCRLTRRPRRQNQCQLGLEFRRLWFIGPWITLVLL